MNPNEHSLKFGRWLTQKIQTKKYKRSSSFIVLHSIPKIKNPINWIPIGNPLAVQGIFYSQWYLYMCSCSKLKNLRLLSILFVPPSNHLPQPCDRWESFPSSSRSTWPWRVSVNVDLCCICREPHTSFWQPFRTSSLLKRTLTVQLHVSVLVGIYSYILTSFVRLWF